MTPAVIHREDLDQPALSLSSDADNDEDGLGRVDQPPLQLVLQQDDHDLEDAGGALLLAEALPADQVLLDDGPVQPDGQAQPEGLVQPDDPVQHEGPVLADVGAGPVQPGGPVLAEGGPVQAEGQVQPAAVPVLLRDDDDNDDRYASFSDESAEEVPIRGDTHRDRNAGLQPARAGLQDDEQGDVAAPVHDVQDPQDAQDIHDQPVDVAVAAAGAGAAIVEEEVGDKDDKGDKDDDLTRRVKEGLAKGTLMKLSSLDLRTFCVGKKCPPIVAPGKKPKYASGFTKEECVAAIKILAEQNKI